ncbi:DegV family protein [Anaerococcus tetradius]|uniref:DegV family protein n=1 Tax=Anaerococcus tetradius TaxID=33036 RepID=UPI0023EFD63F|nr:DegV family protein [Anaerococcus tetradius]
MEKIAIMVDSAADISPTLAEEKGIYYLPLYVNIKDKFLRDRIDISPEEFYAYIKSENYLPKTSLPAPGDIMALVEKIKEDGYDKLIIICLGSKFSGTFNLCDMLEAEGIETFAFDSKNLTLAEGMLAIQAKKLVDEGKSFEEIKLSLEKLRDNSRVFFTLETFKYIIEGGRVPKTFGKISDALSVKPIISISPENAKFNLLKIVRGEKKVFKQFYNIAKENLEGAKEYYFFIAHGDSFDMAMRLEEVLKEFIDGASLFIKDQISPTLGANTGPGLLGFGFLKLE